MSIVRVGETAFVVSVDEVWEMGESGGLVRDEAHSIAATWPGLPRYPDAGFTWHNGLEYIFVGRTLGLELFGLVDIEHSGLFSFISLCQP